jgi:hypothetical protein
MVSRKVRHGDLVIAATTLRRCVERVVPVRDHDPGWRVWAGLPQHAHDRGIHAGFVAGDEVYGSLEPRRSIRNAAPATCRRSAPTTW